MKTKDCANNPNLKIKYQQTHIESIFIVLIKDSKIIDDSSQRKTQ